MSATFEKLTKVYVKMREALAKLDHDRNDSAKKITDQMAKVEEVLIDKLQADKDMNELVGFYNNGRDELDALDNQYKEEKAHLALRQEKLENAIFAVLKDTNVESMRTKNGTAFTSTQASVKIADWGVFLRTVVTEALTKAYAIDPAFDSSRQLVDKVMEQESWALLKRAASKDAVKAYLEENKACVPGVDYTTRLQVSVRRK